MKLLRVGPPGAARPGEVVCVGLNRRDHAAEAESDGRGGQRQEVGRA